MKQLYDRLSDTEKMALFILRLDIDMHYRDLERVAQDFGLNREE